MKKNNLKTTSLIGGGASSILGVLGSLVVIACPCKGILISGIAVSIFGATAATFLHKYSWWFIGAGVLLLVTGTILTINSRKKKNCKCCGAEDSK